MRILVTRPEPYAAEQAAKLSARGHEPVVAPLLRIEFIAPKIDFAGAQAIVVTSRNALRALASHPALEAALRLPLLAVGEATACAAKELSFANVRHGPGTGAELAHMIAEDLDAGAGAILHLSGETLAFDLQSALAEEGFETQRSILYRSLPAVELPRSVLAQLQDGRLDGVVLMSPRTASTFSALIRRSGAKAERLICYCLSEAVAQALRPLRTGIRVARQPNENEVLALIDASRASSPTS
jgi:uroporphyrinogen-III synthase